MDIGGDLPDAVRLLRRGRRVAARRPVAARSRRPSERRRRASRCSGSEPRSHKLGRDERRALVEWTLAEVAAGCRVAVTVADGNVPDMIESARFAVAAGASWLIAAAAAAAGVSGAASRPLLRRRRRQRRLPVGIQNAPEFLGIGLSPDDLLALNGAHPNVSVVKAESTARRRGRAVSGARRPDAGLQRPRRLRAHRQPARRRRRHDPRHRDHRPAGRRRARDARGRGEPRRGALPQAAAGPRLRHAGARHLPALRQADRRPTGSGSRPAATGCRARPPTADRARLGDGATRPSSARSPA